MGWENFPPMIFIITIYDCSEWSSSDLYSFVADDWGSSICQPRSLEPLDVTKDMLFLLMAHQSVPDEFMEIIKSCVYAKQPVEEAYCGSWYSNSFPAREGKTKATQLPK